MEQTREVGAETKCNELSEGSLGTEIMQPANGDAAHAVCQCGTVKAKPCSEGKDCRLGLVCGLVRFSEDENPIVAPKNSRSPNTVISSSITNETLKTVPEDITNNSCTEDQVLSPGDLSKPGEKQKSGFELAHNEDTEINTALPSCSPIEHLESFPTPVTMGAPIEHLSVPHDGATLTPDNKKSQPSHNDMDKQSAIKQFETPSKELVTKSSRRGRSAKSTPKSRKNYILRSLSGNQRVLRSRSNEKPKASESSNTLSIVHPSGEKRKKYKRRRGKGIVLDEYSGIRAQLRYLLCRINYEQSLITAYSMEGWKGLSLEKLKPEKELQRATSEILRRKLKIRDLFQRIDSICAEGKLPASLFDSDGQIDSEDIFCAKCGSKDLTTDNDIILCDGACDRGFHQFCLVPPMLKEEIPPDDEGWLCPGCDCKVDCIYLLNENQGTKLSISDRWEKVFPEAASAAGKNLDHDLGLPSDDSDDNDYAPDDPDIDENSEGDESSSDESDFTSASDGLEPAPDDDKYAGLPSDDSEDDDYNPDGPDFEVNTKQEDSSSDFTSDSEDLVAAICDNELQSEDQSLPSAGIHNGVAPVSSRRNVERLDYKKLYDETYGNVSSDSSDDEDFAEDSSDNEDFGVTIRPRKRRRCAGESVTVNENTPVIKSGTNGGVTKQDLNKPEHSPDREASQNSKFENKITSSGKVHEGTAPSTSNGKKVQGSTYRRLGEATTQRLHSAFKENQYPDRATKDSLAKELALTFNQVDKWFGNARWSFHHSAAMNSLKAETGSTSGKDSSVDKTNESVAESGLERVVSNATDNPSPGEESPNVVASATAETRGEESAKPKSKTTRKSRRRS